MRRIGHVARQRQSADFRGDLPQRFGPPTRDDHAGAFRRKTLRAGGADAGPAAGHDRYPAGETPAMLTVHVPAPWRALQSIESGMR